MFWCFWNPESVLTVNAWVDKKEKQYSINQSIRLFQATGPIDTHTYKTHPAMLTLISRLM